MNFNRMGVEIKKQIRMNQKRPFFGNVEYKERRKSIFDLEEKNSKTRKSIQDDSVNAIRQSIQSLKEFQNTRYIKDVVRTSSCTVSRGHSNRKQASSKYPHAVIDKNGIKVSGLQMADLLAQAHKL